MNDMTEYSVNVIRCIEEWGSAASKCNGNSDCLEKCALQLRHSLDKVFPPSKSIDLESDKINYLLSSVFFLANRLAKGTIGISELDKAIEKMSIEEKGNKELYNRFREQLDEILKKYF